MKHRRIVIIANGDIGNPDYYRTVLKEDDYIICADGGAVHALNMGIYPDLVVGDADSLSEAARRQLATHPAVSYHKYPAEKEKSDLELALDQAVDLNPREILIIGALGGGRIEHTLANFFLLLLPVHKNIPARIIDELHEIHLTGQELTVVGKAGDYVSLFPLTPEVTGLSTEGLKYPLRGEPLYFASTRGLSNELLAAHAKITMQSGLLLVIKTTQNRS